MMTTFKFLAIFAFFSIFNQSKADDKNQKFIIPNYTLSPDHRYGVTIPTVDPNNKINPEPKNNLIEIKTGSVLAIIQSETGYEKNSNYRTTLPVRWSANGNLMLWEIADKWSPAALTLVKIDNGKVAWQSNLITLPQRAILQRTREANPKKYAAAKKANEGNGPAFPDGFTVNVQVFDPISLPAHLRATLDSNPKDIESIPKIYSQLDGIINDKGNFIATDFKIINSNK